MTARSRLWRKIVVTGGLVTLLLACFAFQPGSNDQLQASGLGKHHGSRSCKTGDGEAGAYGGDFEGTWYWLRSPEQEQRVVISLYNRYCIRCHGVDGRGVWDIPDVPDFTNGRWQATRSDGQLARSIVEGRGAVMPQFRGTLSLEESWAVARHLRSFVPGTETPKPDTSKPATPPVPKAP